MAKKRIKDTVSDMYRNQFFKNRSKALSWRVKPLCDAVENTFKFKSIVDVGCATADFLAEFQRRGKDIFGVEGSKWAFLHLQVDFKHVLQLDLKDEFKIIDKDGRDKRYDLCISLEVAEHIRKRYAKLYVNTLGNLSDTILISAAKPGQKGHHHFNCQEQSYWKAMFLENNFEYNKDKTTLFQEGLENWKHKKGLNSYYDNSMVFCKKTRNN